jgi:RNA-directed DNA polymerase
VKKPNTDSKPKTVGWNDINWHQVDRYVYKQQKRIFAASRRGEVKTVRKLQKTLMNSWSCKALSVRRVTQDNRGKKTAGVDGIKSLSPEARVKLVGQLKLTGKSKPTRRVWIPKPGKDEKRPLGIPTMYDRALQGVIKAALEPEWEALFEASSYGFRPGRSCHDAIEHIRVAVQSKAKYVLDADISKCFDRINHVKLLQKIGHTGKVRQQIKAWLKSGVIDQGVFTATTDGTPQGGVISPLLANVALHGLEKMLKKFAKTIDMRREEYPNRQVSWQRKVQSLNFIRYADDFVVTHQDLHVIIKCQELISEWLKDIGLELKPSKTRIAHTLYPELSEDKTAGFDFLGYNIRQYPAGKYISARKTNGNILGFKTIINPSQESCKKHQENIRKVVKKHKHSPQALLIKELNPIIRGWCNYYNFSDASTTNILARQDYLVYEKLRAWGRYRCKNLKAAIEKYFTKIGKRNWIFATQNGETNTLRLLFHRDFGSSSTNYVKVKGDKSPYDGNLVYWSTRMGRHHDMPTPKAYKLKKQKGKCNWCGLHFREGDILEEDHIIPTALGGKNTYENHQLLHGHCHDEKTAMDLIDIRNHKSSIFFKKLTQEWSKVDYLWIDDLPVITSS